MICVSILIDWLSSFLEPCVRCTAKSVFLIFTVLPRFFALFYPDFSLLILPFLPRFYLSFLPTAASCSSLLTSLCYSLTRKRLQSLQKFLVQRVSCLVCESFWCKEFFLFSTGQLPDFLRKLLPLLPNTKEKAKWASLFRANDHRM